MPLGNTFGNDLAKLIFQAIAIADIAENDTSGPLTNLYISLHTADPGLGGNQQTNEATYGSYARVAVARTAAGFTVTGKVVTLVGDATFPTRTSGSETLTHAAIGTAASGAGKIIAAGALSPTIAVAAGVTPIVDAATTTFTIN